MVAKPYNRATTNLREQKTMSNEEEGHEEDSVIDALAATALVVIPVVAVIYWLAGLPTS